MNWIKHLCLVFVLALPQAKAALDSLGVKKENNKTYVIYKLGPKQTLFSVLRKYNISFAEFKQVNPETPIPLKAGETFQIPLHYLEESPTLLKSLDKPVPGNDKEVANKESAAPTSSEPQIHVVAPKQGLLTIANLYGITMAQLREWNQLKSDRLQVGQRLVVKDPAPKLETPALPAAIPTAKVEGKIETKSIETESAASEPSANKEGIKKTIETGIAELIEVPDNTGKYLALHKSAPIGTLILVKNLSNNQSIWVKVVGRLPNSDPKVIIKISPRAFEKLNAVDKKVRAEISYLLQ